MRHRITGNRVALSAVASLLLLAGGAVGAGAATASFTRQARPEHPATSSLTAEASTAADSALAAAVLFRRSYGLNASLTWVRHVARDPRARRMPFGVPLLPSELRLVRAQLSASRSVPAWQAYLVRRFRQSFAGIYIDAAGHVRVGFTDHAARDLASAAAALRQHPLVARAFTAAYSLAYLKQLHERIDRATTTLRAAGALIDLTTVDIAHNEVLVGVSDYSRRLARQLRARYGPAIHVIATYVRLAFDTKIRVPPMEGGYDINTLLALKEEIIDCSSGFVGKDKSSGASVVITAGHCGPLASTWHQGWEFGIDGGVQGPTIGKMLRNSFPNGSDADGAELANAQEPSNRVFLNGFYPAWVAINAVQSPASDYAGEAACKSGITTGVTCGKISSVDTTISYPKGPTLYQQRTATFYAQPGDSGAPVFYGSFNAGGTTTAFGVLSGIICSDSSCTKVTGSIYSQAVHVEQAINANINI
jgi:streptogrisin C